MLESILLFLVESESEPESIWSFFIESILLFWVESESIWSFFMGSELEPESIISKHTEPEPESI